MIYRDDITNLREDIMGKEGQKIIVKGALGRSKFFEKEAKDTRKKFSILP